MKERLINTKLWNDGWIRKLNPLDRYLFIYLLTNERTNISGIYELPLSTMAYDTGIDERDLMKSMLPRLEPKVYYHEEWVILTNFPKHQRLNSSSVIEGIKRSLNEAKKEVVEFAISMGYGDGLPIIPPSSHILNQTKLNQTKLIDMSVFENEFELFWSLYPKKELKKRSKEIWLSKKPPLKEILSFIEKAKKTDRWKKGFVKQPPAFLNGECWNDDLSSYGSSIKNETYTNQNDNNMVEKLKAKTIS